MKETIALIDDDRNILTSLSIALEKEGYKVQTYLDGESALIGLARTPPDLAVIDIKTYSQIIQEEMSSVKNSNLHSFSIPLLVDINVGNNWGDLH